MANEILKKDQLENLLQQQWGKFLDHLRLMRVVMEDVSNTSFKEIEQQDIPDRHVKFSLTKFSIVLEPDHAFEFWVEFTIPKQNGVVIGTSVYLLKLNGDISLRQCFGTHFRPKILK
jgi:hypothetical protein